MSKILVVDDSPTMRRMIIATLREISPVQFEEAESGLGAIEKLALFRFDLLILDLNMPDMHGMEVLRFVRQHKNYSEIPVVILTTKNDESSRSEALNAGASLFYTKPYDTGVFAAGIKRLLKSDKVNHE